MENIDPNMEQRVWGRVMGKQEPQPEREDLRSLMLAALEAAAAYRYLANALSGKHRERMKGLYEKEQANIACLRGMQLLSGANLRSAAMSAPKEAHRKALEKSYHRARRALTEYTARTVDSEFGAVFQSMADREREGLAVLAEVLGSLATP